MKKLRGAVNSKWGVLALAALVFLFMLILNFLTPYVADDYVYRWSFYDRSHVETLEGVLRSMYVHSYAMNGRVISHFFGQLFMIWPKAVFNVVNAGVFTLLWYLLWRIASVGAKRSIFMAAGIFMALWYWMPVFGQVALWQLGSVNYLWGLAWGMLFVCPYVYRFMYGGELLRRSWQRAIFCLGALIFGMYIEVMSFVGLFIAAALMALSRIFDKKSLKSWLLIPIGLGAAGYAALMCMPAEMKAKQSKMTLDVLLKNFAGATEMLTRYGQTLLILWAVVLVTALFLKIPGKRAALSAVLALGAVGGNYMLTFAGYYPDRCASATVTLLILAVAVLLTGMDFDGAGGAVRRALLAALMVVFALSLVSGTYSIWQNHVDFKMRESAIYASLEKGERDLSLPVIHASTPYSAYWGLLDLNTEQTDTWPNLHIADYYGADTVIGY